MSGRVGEVMAWPSGGWSPGAELGWMLLTAALILLGAHALVLAVRWLVRGLARSRVGRGAKARTLAQFLGSIATFVLYFVAAGWALALMGVPLTTYIASATVIGFAVSFGSQGVVQDVISGLTLITSDLLDVGDMVDIGGQVGVVRSIGIRYTQLSTLTCSRVSIPNRNVTNVINYELGYTRVFLDVRLPADGPEGAGERLGALALAAYEQFRGVMPRGPVVSGPAPVRTGGSLVRIEFRVWPGQGAVVETAVRQQIVGSMRELNASYAEWMVTAHYRAEPCEAAGRAHDG